MPAKVKKNTHAIGDQPDRLLPPAEQRKKTDPVMADQSGRLMPADPLGTNAPREEQVRRRAYEIYEQRGKEEGRALQHWLDAECELQ